MYHSCRKAICDTYKSAAEIQRAKESGELSSKNREEACCDHLRQQEKEVEFWRQNK